MMELLRAWLTGITAAAILCALANSLMPEGAVRRVGKLACGLLMLSAVLRPLVEVEALSPGDRMLLEGKYILGYSDRELARRLNCRETAIRMRLCRARHRAMNLILTLEGSEV